ncbi:MAG: response regulator [Taibaiella sp.]|nr:response regulator [Taibaiella sp.]
MRSKKILLIDDDEDDQLMFCDALNEINSSVECAVVNNGQAGLDYLYHNPPPPDIIFLDLNMPIMNGYECLTALKQQDSYKDIPVIIFSTSSSPVDIAKTKKLGADVFITKPNDYDALRAKLGNIINSDYSMS